MFVTAMLKGLTQRSRLVECVCVSVVKGAGPNNDPGSLCCGRLTDWLTPRVFTTSTVPAAARMHG